MDQHHYLNAEEINFLSPYGNLIAKVWGKKSGPCVLMLHGSQDNAATFDELIPFLPSNLYYVAIEFSSHGLSAQMPKDVFVTRTGYLIEIRRWVKYLDWKSFSIIGHSDGAGLGILYAAYYPDEIEGCISIDYLFPGSVFKSLPLGKALDMLFEAEEKMQQPAPVKSLQDILEQYCQTRPGLPRKAALKMVERCHQLTDGEMYISMEDPRIRNVHLSYDQNAPSYIFQYLPNIKAPFLLIRASQSTATKLLPEAQTKTLNILKEKCQSFMEITFEGNHYIHAEKPEEIGKYISEFFKTIY